MWLVTQLLVLLSYGLCPLKAGLPTYVSDLEYKGPRNENASYSRLLYDLLKPYDPLAVPVSRHRDILNVTLSYTLFQLVSMDDSSEMVVVNSWIRTDWMDRFLRWNPQLYDEIDHIALPGSYIWLPDIAVFNGGSEGEQDIRSMSNSNVQVKSNGRVTWWVKYIGKTPCAFELSSFPWDVQTCDFEIGPWVTDRSMMDLIPTIPAIRATDTCLWSIEGIEHKKYVFEYEGIRYPRVIYDINFKRKPLFYIFNFLIPAVLLAIISLTAYLFPVDVSERVSLPIALFLSASFLLFASTGYMPIQSEVIPVIAQILCKLMADILICIIFNVLIIKFASWSSKHRNLDDRSDLPEQKGLNECSGNNAEGGDENEKVVEHRRNSKCWGAYMDVLELWVKRHVESSFVNRFFFTINVICVFISVVWLLWWAL